MATRKQRPSQSVEFNKSVQGLITEANPLSFPPLASVDEVNFILNKDGGRRRRLGIDKRSDVAGRLLLSTDRLDTVKTTTAMWYNVDGVQGQDRLAVHMGTRIYFFDASTLQPVGGVSAVDPGENGRVSMTSIDGSLVVATGETFLRVFSVEDGVERERSPTIKVRDTFGAEDVDPVLGLDMYSPEGLHQWTDDLDWLGVDFKSWNEAGERHIYNLRNQGFNRVFDFRDPLQFLGETPFFLGHTLTQGLIIPPNSALYPTGATSGGQGALYTFYKKQEDNGSFEAPRGAFIIDLLKRGSDRESQYNVCPAVKAPPVGSSIAIKYGKPLTTLPSDISPDGATVVAQFSGRVFYAGFTDKVEDGDNRSPKLAPYVAYSQIVRSPDDIAKCYTAGDPANVATSDVVVTDGGLIRIAGARQVVRMMAMSDSLIVFCTNGVWAIRGTSEGSFSATVQQVVKVSDHPAISHDSIVDVDGQLVYWAEDAIHTIVRSDSGILTTQNMTTTTIQTFYDDIPLEDKVDSIGVFDSFERKVRWLYGTDIFPVSTKITRELIFDAGSGAFSVLEIKNTTNRTRPRIVGAFNTEPFSVTEEPASVLVVGDTVVAGVDDVVANVSTQNFGTREVNYLVVEGPDTTNTPSTMLFARYSNGDFIDWDYTLEGVDADAFMVSGYMAAGDTQRFKQAPYLTMHFNITENFVTGPPITITDESSCLVQAQWEWAVNANSGRWGREFQSYRFKRHVIPTAAGSYKDVSGFSMVTTKNKIRGKGRALSFKIRTEPGKDLQLLGWALVLDGNANV